MDHPGAVKIATHGKQAVLSAEKLTPGSGVRIDTMLEIHLTFRGLLGSMLNKIVFHSVYLCDVGTFQTGIYAGKECISYNDPRHEILTTIQVCRSLFLIIQACKSSHSNCTKTER